MALFAEELLRRQEKIGHVFYVAPPVGRGFFRGFFPRIRDSLRVFTGRYTAIRFYGPEMHKDDAVKREVRLVSRDDIEKAVANAHDLLARTKLGLKIDEFGNADVPRNAPCPCGSGYKFKKCHGSQEV